MEKREQVFISSTYLDLRDARELVIQALLEAECFPAGMELFPAGDEEKWDLIKGVIDDSDYYLLIIGGRYGSVDQLDNLSYTEKEYDYALETKKPVMAFVHSEPENIPAKFVELSEDRRLQLEAFKTKVENKIVKYWTEPKDLPGGVAQALLRLRRKSPAIGWVRGNHAMTAETRAEIAELRAALAEARKADPGDSPIFDDLADGEDTFEVKLYLRYFSTGRIRMKQSTEGEISWDDVFGAVGPLLLHESTEVALDKKTISAIIGYFRSHYPELPEDYDELIDLTVQSGIEEIVRVQLLALALIERGTEKRTVSDRNRYWKLTKRGEDRLMAMRAIRHVDSGYSEVEEAL